MASGWASDDAVNQQIESTIIDAIENARHQLSQNKGSSLYCLECGKAIPEARRAVLLNVQHCVQCQHEIDKETQKTLSIYNRRGSKDSQLR